MLGAASYVDAVLTGNLQYYLSWVERLNPVLLEHLGWVYEHLRHTLSKCLGEPVKFAEGLSVPGYHLFLYHPELERLNCAIHLDSQSQAHDWKRYGEVDARDPLSFTAAISLPRDGAGMNIWNFSEDDAHGMTRDAVLGEIRNLNPNYIRYQTGRMLIHSGRLFHQIAPMRGILPGEERITLQGHAVCCSGVWQLYW